MNVYDHNAVYILVTIATASGCTIVACTYIWTEQTHEIGSIFDIR